MAEAQICENRMTQWTFTLVIQNCCNILVHYKVSTQSAADPDLFFGGGVRMGSP
jgi:hypothetical protein